MRAVRLALAGLAATLIVLWLLPRSPQRVRARLSLAEALSGESDKGYAQALEPRPFEFPADHGPHPDFRQEWWYYTGNLETQSGRHFGYQMTFFRRALTASPIPRSSAWAARHAYMAHFTVTDVAGQRFFAHERFARAALSLAGATAQPFRVWLYDWSVSASGVDTVPMELRGQADDVSVRLTLTSLKPVVLQGERGWSRKGERRGDASYYYSLTRMPTHGTVAIEGEVFLVRGESWMDREWSTSSLAPSQTGWDWFSLQLTDGSELMVYRLRRADGSTDPFSGGSLVDPSGEARNLGADEVIIETLDQWRSPLGGAIYPSRWRLQLPAEDLRLEVTPHLANQELDLSVRYWEGAVAVEGWRAGRRLRGNGYVELTGYEEAEG